MQKSRKDRVRRPEGRECSPATRGRCEARRLPSVPPPAPLLKVLLLRTTARQPLRGLLLPPLRAAPWLATWRRWTCRRGAGPQVRPRTPVQVSTLGRSPGAPLSCGRSSGEVHSHPLPRAALLLASPGARTSAPGP